MNIGFIGAGHVAQTYASYFAKAGHQITLSNSRGPASLAGIVQSLGPNVQAGTVQEAATKDIVVLAVRWEHAKKALSEVPDWKDRLLVDATNRPAAEGPKAEATGEIIAGFAPGASVVKALNTLVVGWMPPPTESKDKLVLFISGDDKAAKQKVAGLLEESGFASVDLGGLSESGRLQDFGGPLSGLQMNLVKRMKS